MKSIRDVMICYCVNTFACERAGIDPATVPPVALVPWPDEGDRARLWSYSEGACFTKTRRLKPVERGYHCMSIALGLILRKGFSPAVVHAALWDLKEYRDSLPGDTLSPDGKSNAGDIWL